MSKIAIELAKDGTRSVFHRDDELGVWTHAETTEGFDECELCLGAPPDSSKACREKLPDPIKVKGSEGSLFHRHDSSTNECLGYEIAWSNRTIPSSFYSRVASLPPWARALLPKGSK
jgi:hypothetical protein